MLCELALGIREQLLYQHLALSGVQVGGLTEREVGFVLGLLMSQAKALSGGSTWDPSGFTATLSGLEGKSKVWEW